MIPRLLSWLLLASLTLSILPHDPWQDPSTGASFAVSAVPAAAPPRESGDYQLALGRLSSRCRTLSEAEIHRLATVLVRESRVHELPVELILGVIEVESNYNPFAVSPVGAMGLMQVLPSTGAEVAGRVGVVWRGPQTLFDPFVNVRLGTTYLRELRDRYGSVSVALAAYNWGPGRIDRRLRRGSPLPVVYAGRVLDASGQSDFKTDS
jgi:soluble lytic murein transglycosylase-like protein